jgi:periplasmic divalent cation tolerance protein
MTSKRVMQIQVVHSDRDALDGIITDLVEERLIACGQVIGPISSTFFWEGSVQNADEWLALLKTSEGVVPDLVAHLAELHSYDLPEILVTEVAGGYMPYLDWVVEQTGRGHLC